MNDEDDDSVSKNDDCLKNGKFFSEKNSRNSIFEGKLTDSFVRNPRKTVLKVQPLKVT